MTKAKRQRLEPFAVCLVVGKRGAGKSHHLKGMLAGELAGGARVCAFDFHDEYSHGGRPSKVVDLGPCAARVTMEDLVRSPELLDDPHLSLAVVPRPVPELAAEDLADLAELVLASGRMTFAIDELGAVEEWCRSSVNFLCTQSRHSEVPVLLGAQRTVQIPKTARTQATEIVSFVQSNPDDLRELERIAGPDFAARVSRLPRREFCHWRDDDPSPALSERPTRRKYAS